jgi:hypothetical protein
MNQNEKLAIAIKALRKICKPITRQSEDAPDYWGVKRVNDLCEMISQPPRDIANNVLKKIGEKE